MKNTNTKRRLITFGIAAILLAVVGFFLRFPPGPRPVCHRALDGALAVWASNTGQTNGYPNVNGKGSASLAVIEPWFGDRIQLYGYVPGLRFDDPKNLVFMYLKEKTRHSWHGDTEHSIFSPRLWMVLSPDILDSAHCPEGGELLDTAEFKKRLEMTIAFLKREQRPFWQAIADEQIQFLKSIQD